MAGQHKHPYLRRVEGVLQKLGVEGKRVSDEVLEAEFELKQLHDQIIELHQARKWEEYDKTQEQIQVLTGRCPELRDTHYHEQCVRLRVCSHGKRKDPHQFLRALGIHKGIDLQKTFGDNE